MISCLPALEIIKNKSENYTIDTLTLTKCLHLVLAEDIFAPIHVPPFDNSAMDGYAFRFDDYQNELELTITHEIQAGTNQLTTLDKGEVARIFTGAPIPKNADTVVAQEHVSIQNNTLCCNKHMERFENIRKKGTQTQEGTLILKKNTVLTAENLGFLATFGIDKLPVFTPPKVGLIVTGKELQKAGHPLRDYQIYESNSVFLTAALAEIGIEPVFSIWADDDAEILKNIVGKNIEKVDILIFTGGISVGEYDYVKPVLEDLGIEQSFYKVRQKPGKPLFFGTLYNTAIFALPGNPSAVVMCYHAYLKPFITTQMGCNSFDTKEYGILQNTYSKKVGLTHFVKAFVENNKVEILSNQLSYQMDAYAHANAFAILPENQENFQIGDQVEVIKFQH